MAPGRLVKLSWYIEIIPKLGVWNVLYVFIYRILLTSGFSRKKYPVYMNTEVGPVFFESPVIDGFPGEWQMKLLEQADRIINGELPNFSYHWIKQSIPPNWFLNPFNGKCSKDQTEHWSKISDFSSELGDIKCLWEASRFTWLGILARAYVVSGRIIYLETLNNYIDNWIYNNPVNQGPNWKCGQEASFRVLALLNAANILTQSDNPSNKLKVLISQHLERISLNTRYAFAQRNNHATSEAAALFIGGNWLQKVAASGHQQARTYSIRGRRALENLVGKLTYEDGSFSQHSVVYHRLFLDTLTSVIFWTRELDIQQFTSEFYEHITKVYDWLYAMIDESGRCPNFGSNDGTLLLSNHSCDYRDFRPSLQLASVFLKSQLAFYDGPHNEALFWFGIKDIPDNVEPYKKTSRLFKSGYVIMSGSDCWAMLRFPNFRFRPSHNDALHFDLWADGNNLLFDSGSYSYNPNKNCTIPDLKSVHSHNTLSFDQGEQMPRLGRFLLAKWLKPFSVSDIVQSAEGSGAWEGSYKDAVGNLHLRRIHWDKRHWEIFDHFSGSAAQVQIGFNFDLCEYTIDQDANKLNLPWGSISVSKNAELSVKSHRVSHYYFQSVECNRLIVTARNNTELKCSINIF